MPIRRRGLERHAFFGLDCKAASRYGLSDSIFEINLNLIGRHLKRIKRQRLDAVDSVYLAGDGMTAAEAVGGARGGQVGQDLIDDRVSNGRSRWSRIDVGRKERLALADVLAQDLD